MDRKEEQNGLKRRAVMCWEAEDVVPVDVRVCDVGSCDVV